MAFNSYNADQFIASMQEAVMENESMNMSIEHRHLDEANGQNNEDRILAGWTNAQAIIDIYDEVLQGEDENEESSGGEFEELSAEEQTYVLAKLNAWLAAKRG